MIDGAFQEQLKAKRSLSSLCSARRPAASQVEFRHPQNTPLEPQTAKKQRGAFRTNSVYKIAGKFKKKSRENCFCDSLSGRHESHHRCKPCLPAFPAPDVASSFAFKPVFFLFFVGDILKQVKLDAILNGAALCREPSWNFPPVRVHREIERLLMNSDFNQCSR